jgi:hypothetical protein
MTLEQKLEIPAVQIFYVTQMLITPIEGILERLKKDLYSNESIPYLEGNLLKYAEMASKIKGFGHLISFIAESNEKDKRLFYYQKKEYIKYFQTLLDCFKKIVE